MKKRELDSELIRLKIKSLIENFEDELKGKDLRRKVLSLVPVFHHLRELGKSLLSKENISSARDRILFYFNKYPGVVINGDELLVVSAIQEYARRVRELRVQFGWSIISGVTAKEMAAESDLPIEGVDIGKMKPNEYILLSPHQDRDAAHRWNMPMKLGKETIPQELKSLITLNIM